MHSMLYLAQANASQNISNQSTLEERDTLLVVVRLYLVLNIV